MPPPYTVIRDVARIRASHQTGGGHPDEEAPHRVFLYIMNRSTFCRPGRNPTLRDPTSPIHRFCAQRAVCARLPSETDRSLDPRTQWRRGCGSALLIVDDAHHPTITLSTGPSDRIQLLLLPDRLYVCKPMLLNLSRSGLKACGETRAHTKMTHCSRYP